MPSEPPAGFTQRRRGVGVGHNQLGKCQPAPVTRYGASERHPSLAAGATFTFPPTPGGDKGKVEGPVGSVWRIFLVPLPRVPSFGPGFAIEVLVRAARHYPRCHVPSLLKR